MYAKCTSSCSALNGITVPIVWNATDDQYEADTTISGQALHLQMACIFVWNLIADYGGSLLYDQNATSADCAGFDIEFPSVTGEAGGPCAGESISWSVTG